MLDLRARITLAMFVAAMLSSSVFAFSIFTASEDLEQAVLARLLDEEARFVGESAAEIHDGRHSALLSLIGSDPTQSIPAALASLPTGQHHGVRLDDRAYQVLVRETGSGRQYITYDITDWENKERRVLYVLVVGVLIVSLLAVLFGRWAARPVVAPIAQFAAQVAAIDPRHRGPRLQQAFQGLEIESIAQAVDGYSDRLRGFIEREQAFTASASHELRTPLAVMQGALDILEDDIESDRGNRALIRIRRAVREMSEYINALMLLAREEVAADAAATTDVFEVLQQLLEVYRPLAEERGNQMQLKGLNTLSVAAPASLLSIAISNLLRNALQYTEHGTITVTLSDTDIAIVDTGSGIPGNVIEQVFDRGFTTRPGGTGMGLFLVRQICERYGWQVTLAPQPDHGTLAQVSFDTGLRQSPA